MYTNIIIKEQTPKGVGTIKIIFNYVAYLLQIVLIIGAFILQYFSNKKMGVARYLVYKNGQFEAGLFSSNMILVYKLLTIFAAAAITLLLIKSFRGKRHNYIKATLVINSVLIAFSSYYTFFADSANIRALYFILIAFYTNIIIQFLRSYFLLKKQR
ncbi:hypothetical protein [Brassicibacter mesophilus]|uniref:hypothetical protein n=1 Tax=Brassicibacter mesophilus TaxID=745119 RepID=UPI003D1F436D